MLAVHINTARTARTVVIAATVAAADQAEAAAAITCQICMHSRANLALVSCGHRFCNGCMGRLQATGATRCAFCRQEYTGTIPVFL